MHHPLAAPPRAACAPIVLPMLLIASSPIVDVTSFAATRPFSTILPLRQA